MTPRPRLATVSLTSTAVLSKAPPTVQVEADERTVDVRAWARGYVRVLLELEGVAPLPSALPRAG